MKTKLLIFAFTLISTASFAQLSVNETINYIQKKLRETKDFTRTFDDKYTYRISEIDFGRDKENANKLILQYTRMFSDKTSDKLQYIFDVTHLSNVSLSTSDATTEEVIGMINLSFVGNTVLFKKLNQGSMDESNKTSFLMPFFRVDPLNFERLKKAFFHLKETYAGMKAPDPFAN